MNPWLLKLADGTSFFAGMLVVIIAVLLQVWLKHRLARSALSIALFFGLLLILLSSTPLSIAQYVIWLLILLAAIVALYTQRSSWQGLRIRLMALGLLVIVSLMLCLQELRYRLSPRILANTNVPVYVIGDSLSAGVGQGEKVWPSVFAGQSGLTVRNLAVGGSKLADALAQARLIPQNNALVILEIGGNDILGNGRTPTDVTTFRRQLEQLLETLADHQHHIVMFELPLPPLSNGYGRAQRKLAAKYGVTLIPKAYLAETLGLPEGTIDGLHLSQKGHDHLARQVHRLLQPAV